MSGSDAEDPPMGAGLKREMLATPAVVSNDEETMAVTWDEDTKVVVS